MESNVGFLLTVPQLFIDNMLFSSSCSWRFKKSCQFLAVIGVICMVFLFLISIYIILGEVTVGKQAIVIIHIRCLKSMAIIQK